ncbi:MAG: hypothetical protein ACRC4M_02055 [Mycoplasma sp.]
METYFIFKERNSWERETWTTNIKTSKKEIEERILKIQNFFESKKNTFLRDFEIIKKEISTEEYKKLRELFAGKSFGNYKKSNLWIEDENAIEKIIEELEKVIEIENDEEILNLIYKRFPYTENNDIY